ncbi:MAG: 4Fe-4S dicluster domain-containing protein [Desulfocurvibacter africanus]
MSKYYIRTNQARCISCKACEVHCKAKNRVPKGAKLGILVSTNPVKEGDNPKILNLFMPCFHCEQPWCVAACPTGAMTRRDKDGIVYVNAELCVGCKACIVACPWKIPQWDETSGRAIKCDFCRDRLDQGLKPACVTACTARALEFVEPNTESEKTRTAIGLKMIER